MGLYDTIIYNLPEVAAPKQKRLAFKEKLKWTLVILVLFYILGLIPLYGLGGNALAQFEFLSIILGASFGSLVSLGIGPIVTASIVLQLLNGSGIVKFDLTSPEGKRRFQGTQKIMSLFFIFIEAVIYVYMGGLSPQQGIPASILVFQLIVGGILILFMDEVVSKWGFGSGISLFIAAGVSQSLFIRALSPLASPTNPAIATGAIPALVQSLPEDPISAAINFGAIVSTILVFLVVVYFQSMKVEIPLSFGRIRGHGVRWPLNFLYTSNIPVILIAALIANIQLFARLLQNSGRAWLGTFAGNSPATGLVAWLTPPNLVRGFITNSLRLHPWYNSDIVHALFYMLVLIGGSVLFSVFWVQTSGLDAHSQAKQMMSSGLQIPGFRKDQRILERLLNRYITPLTVMGGIAIGFLAGLADISGALTSGTGLLLAVMIIYKLYEDIARQHIADMNPMMRKFMGA
ncbi:preprotein translocase subunit SecY [Candidatus Woesearchaeota archaeon]|nr:preprotein translocase subunit SecY [Candidatus Woesearchaeota archaeon]